ncbi:hypothetical protein MLD38_015593 [Melastoma candidum]|uniref:Uncharacterized protein n=1 Tax=Melastoma candidum TaxID=119954 RepID=A0ACB9RHS7_9MYRT|nr:hypothetical protein MLD38_015593 [Melastoma candidum]
MDKYMRKARPIADLPLLAGPPHSAGVRTRSASAAAASLDSGSFGYLQLRSRLLIRKPQGRLAPRDGNAGGRRRRRTRTRSKGMGGGGVDEEEGDQEGKKVEEPDDGRVGTAQSGEASCGENGLELRGRERSTRETTPCSLHNDPDGARTPGSTTKPSNLTQTNRRLRSADRQNVPSTNEMDNFFAGAEEEQQKTFIDKYNFDPVNEKPLPGRFEWEKLNP